MTLSLRPHLLLVVLLVAAALPAQVKGKVGKQDKPKRPVGGAVLLVQDNFSAPLKACTVSKDGSMAVICTEDGKVHFTRLDTRLGDDPKKVGEGDNSFPYKIEDAFLSSKGERLIGRINASTVAIVTKKPKILHLLRGMPGLVVMTLHPDGVQFAGGMQNGLIRTWDTSNGKPLNYLSMLNQKTITCLSFTPDGKSLIGATDDKRLWRFNYPDGEKLSEVEVPGVVRQVAFTADGSTMVFPAGDTVRVWEVKAMTEKSSFDTGIPVLRAAVSADGRRIAVAHGGGVVALYDAATGKKKKIWEAHPGKEIVCLQLIKPRGKKRMLVTAAAKGDVVYWDVLQLITGDQEAGKKGKKGRKSKRKRRKR